MIRWRPEAPIGTPYWWTDRAAPATNDELPARVDVLVVGAGYTGLSAAIHACDAGASVAVVDSGQPGQGASTRNGGMFGSHPRQSWEALAAIYGEATADAVFAEAGPAQTFVTQMIRREGIDCALQTTGRIQLAWTKTHFEAQKRLAERVRDKSGVPIEVIGRDALGDHIRTDLYKGGILFPHHCGIDPRALHDGLSAAARRRGVPVVGHTPVTGWQRTRDGFVVETAAGQVRAAKVVLATNGYTPRAFPWHRLRVFPVPSFIIATEELPPDLIAAIAPGRRMMVETRARHSYYRISPDGRRILFGGRAAMRRMNPAKGGERLFDTMCQIWPELGGVAVTHAWTGNTGFSFNHLPNVGQDRGLVWAMGYSGSGTVLAPYLGAKAGLLAAEGEGADTPYADTRFRPSWLNPTGTPHFLWAADLWFKWAVDPAQDRAARN